MNIYEVIRTLPPKKAQFVRYYFNLWFDPNKTMTEEEFLKSVQLKSMSSFNRFMKTEEWRHITNLVLASKSAEDMLKIYEVTKSKAEQGDDKAISTILKLQSVIQGNQKQAIQYFNDAEDVEEDDDGLEV